MVDMDNMSGCRMSGPTSFFCKCEDARNNTFTCLRTIKGEDTVRCFFKACSCDSWIVKPFHIWIHHLTGFNFSLSDAAGSIATVLQLTVLGHYMVLFRASIHLQKKQCQSKVQPVLHVVHIHDEESLPPPSLKKVFLSSPLTSSLPIKHSAFSPFFQHSGNKWNHNWSYGFSGGVPWRGKQGRQWPCLCAHGGHGQHVWLSGLGTSLMVLQVWGCKEQYLHMCENSQGRRCCPLLFQGMLKSASLGLP